jgi:hypothetical protein
VTVDLTSGLGWRRFGDGLVTDDDDEPAISAVY